MSKSLYLLVKNLISSICLGVDDGITVALFSLWVLENPCTKPGHKPVSGSVCKALQCGLEKQVLDCKCSFSFAPSQGKPFST